ncbi:hypothetical protein K4F52_009304 [Lecanicillium sp. MT-2017a]|nr:hypothetical protein K4F52_009304 [Lecanicillium sp. MT-2017a]
MKYTCVAALTLIAGALAAPAANMANEQQMKALEVLHSNKHALGLSQEQSAEFDKLMASINKRQAPSGGAGAMASGAAPSGAMPTPGGAMTPGAKPMPSGGAAPGGALGGVTDALGGVTGSLGGLTGGALGGKGGDKKDGGLLGGILIPGIL